MINGTSWRRRRPEFLWVVLALLFVVASGCGALIVALWTRAGEIERLEVQVSALQSERLGLESRLGTLQDTAAATEQRLAALEANDPALKMAALEQAVEAATGAAQTAELRAALASIQAQVDGFQDDLDSLSARISSLDGDTGTLPSEAHITITPQRQEHNLSCESSAASMAARFHGVDLSEAAVLSALPRSDNPSLGFRGNVDGPTGGIQDYGVYAGPVKQVLEAFGLRALPVDGGLHGIRAAVARGNPVIAWVTYQLAVSTPVVETIGGQEVILVPNQHVVVVTGYDSGGVWANDPWTGQEVYYSADDFDRAMAYFGNMALEVAGP